MRVFAVVGPDEASLDAAARRLMSMRGMAPDTDPRAFREALRARGIAGTTDQVVDQLGRLAELGVQEIMFQHFNFDSDLVPEYLAAEIAPRVKGLQRGPLPILVQVVSKSVCLPGPCLSNICPDASLCRVQRRHSPENHCKT